MRICILSLDTYGDLILREPMMARMIEAGHQVAIVTRPPITELLPFLGAGIESIGVDVHPYRPTEPGPLADAIKDLERRIRDWSPDALLLPLFNRTGVDELLLGRFAGLQRIGFAPGIAPSMPRHDVDALTGWATSRALDKLFTQVLPVDASLHETEKYALLMDAWLGLPLARKTPVLRLGPTERAIASAELGQLGLAARRYAICAPAGSTGTGLKRITAQMATRIARHLMDTEGLAVLLTGVESERAHLVQVAGELQRNGLTAKSWIGRPGQLAALLGLIESSALYFGADTGPMHMACALGRDTLALFGGGHFPRFTPCGPRAFVATQRLPCFGCGWVCRQPGPVCIDAIDPSVVLKGLDRLRSGQIPGVEIDTGIEPSAVAAKLATSGIRIDLSPGPPAANITTIAGPADGRGAAAYRLPAQVMPKGRFSLFLPPEHTLASIQRDHPLYDRFLPHLAKFLAAGSTVIDVGANCGDTLASMLDANTGLRFLCLEPDDSFYSYLRHTAAGISEREPAASITLVKALVGKQVKSASLDRSGGTSKAVSGTGEGALRSSTLDALAGQTQLQPVELLKVDVDGYDYDVIDSASALIERDRPLIFFECQHDNEAQKAAYVGTITRLARLGYSDWVVFDNFGNPLLRTIDAGAIAQLFEYVWRQNRRIATRTIWYFDLLAVPPNRRALIDSALESYPAAA